MECKEGGVGGEGWSARREEWSGEGGVHGGRGVRMCVEGEGRNVCLEGGRGECECGGRGGSACGVRREGKGGVSVEGGGGVSVEGGEGEECE